MTDHLPECLLADSPPYGWRCICDRLRACEQRMTRSKERVIQEAEFNYRRGLSAARDAVAAVPLFDRFALGRRFRHEALAAIDALKEDQ